MTWNGVAYSFNESPDPTSSNALESGVQGELVPVCRFYTTKFAPKSSHFYSAFAHECEATRGNSDWTFETDAFYAALPSATGQCTAGLRPVYRLCNNGGTGPPITSSRLR